MRTEDLKKEAAAARIAETIMYLELMAERFNMRIEITCYPDRERRPRWVVAAFGGHVEGSNLSEIVPLVFQHVIEKTGLKP